VKLRVKSAPKPRFGPHSACWAWVRLRTALVPTSEGHDQRQPSGLAGADVDHPPHELELDPALVNSSGSVAVANIDNAFAAHIHCGTVGVNGPVGVTLFMDRRRAAGERHPGRGNDYRGRLGQRVRLDRPGLGPRRDREW
jgi:hypothetical protein